MKQHLTVDYFKWLFFKVSTTGLIILSVYFFMIDKEPNIILAISLFVLSMLTFSFYRRIKPTPPLATCLDKSGLIAGLYATITMSTGAGFILLGIAFGVDKFVYEVAVVFGIAGTLFVSGVVVYIYNCKENGVLRENV